MSQDLRDLNTYTNENGKTWLKGEDGKLLKDDRGRNIPSSKGNKNHDDGSGFTTYDTSQGHCGLCGDLYCRGGCFK